MYQFELIAGRHVDEKGTKYQRGDRISSNVELDKRFGSNKFRRIQPEQGGGTATVQAEPEQDDWESELDLERMSVRELRVFAEQEEIDLEGCTRKAQIVERIREHL